MALFCARSAPKAASFDGQTFASVDPRLSKLLDTMRELGADFTVVEMLRSVEDQEKAISKGASMVKDAVTAPHVRGVAADLKANPDDMSGYLALARIAAQASELLGIEVRWGGAWKTLTTQIDPAEQVVRYKQIKAGHGEAPFIDPGHFELRG